jgi:5'(3')-deoxyribonucleotidase
MWTKLNETMLGFMADSAQANWNVIKIVYGYGDPSIRMVDIECTYLFHWTQSFDRRTKKLMKPELQNQHNILCHQYKNAKSLRKANNIYVAIHCWWLSSEVTSKESVH